MLQRIAEDVPERLQVLRVEAGWSAVLGLPGCVGEVDCAERLIRERSVVVHPGAFYGMRERNRVVVSLIGQTRDLEEGIQCAIVDFSTSGKLQGLDELK
jgi:aspartate/methionine/tyrosine aminotransferase